MIFVVAIAVPLAGSTSRIVNERLTSGSVEHVAKQWAGKAGWEVVSVDFRNGSYVIRAVGQLPSPDPRTLRAQLDSEGLEHTDIRLELVPEAQIDLPALG